MSDIIPVRRAARWHRLLLCVPFVWCIAAVPLVNTVPYAFGHIPFLLVWMTAGVVVGSAAIGIVYLMDRSRGDLEAV
jgi:4-hydroxybenzoate polyprenyltransferase